MTKTIQLKEPIPREGSDVTAVTLREPMPGELRGLKLAEILMMDVAALIKLVPRISDPALNEAEVAKMNARDFTQVGGTLVGFFADEDELPPGL